MLVIHQPTHARVVARSFSVDYDDGDKEKDVKLAWVQIRPELSLESDGPSSPAQAATAQDSEPAQPAAAAQLLAQALPGAATRVYPK